MGSEVDASAIDSDSSVSWEEFFGTGTDLVPQLLGMFDELARRNNAYDHVVLPSATRDVIQKRLSLIPRKDPNVVSSSYRDTETMTETTSSCNERCLGDSGTALRCNRRCRNNERPLSGSSIASSTSSSGCSNQGNGAPTNPYLASVESLADTCASSQGSADSGVVVTTSETGNDVTGQRRNSLEGNSAWRRPRYCDPHRNPVERVLMEIVDTESIYVEHLRQVIQGYLIFWRGDPSFAHQLQLNDLFSNIEDIFQFNGEFLKELEKCNLDPVSVANTFIKHNSGFKVYTEYCTNYPRTVSVLTDLMGRENTASAFRERQSVLGHDLPLGSFLLKPVQRILKYHLLLENLSKEYDADSDSRENESEGRRAIEDALAAMTGIAQHINAMKRRHEHAVRVQEIQSLLYGWSGPDLTTSGELVAEGRFRLRGAKAPRHAFLFDKMLLLAKKKEDGLLVYKAHIMCSNLMLIESIPGDPFSFHVIPFDNPRLQYTLQARNLEQKREWTLQIKRVMLENYNADIPQHARQLVLQIGQSQAEDETQSDSRSFAKRQHSSPPEYLEKRKQERERRRSETGLRQKLRKGVRKSDANATNGENSPSLSGKSDDIHDSKEQHLNRSSDGRGSKVKDRLTSWRRKSEPGFQSYVSLEDDPKEEVTNADSPTSQEPESPSIESREEEKSLANTTPPESKENVEQPTQPQTVEEIVGHILMQNQEFQKLLEKQRTNSIINVRQQQRFHKHMQSVETSDESDTENTNDFVNNRTSRIRSGASREQRINRVNNAWNALDSSQPRENQPLRLAYDNFKADEAKGKILTNRVHEKRALFEAFKRQSIVTESKVIKTALRIRENSTSEKDEKNEKNESEKVEAKNFGNYDNLEHVWDGLREDEKLEDSTESPTKPAVWLTKLCEGLPTSPQKCGSLPRSFQINGESQPKSRFLQRDGRPMTERPFTIASDKPAEINLEDMERYATDCQPEGRIAKFPTSGNSTSTFFCSIDENLGEACTETRITSMTANVHPDHKIYATGSTILKSVLSKAGSRLQGLRNTISTETLECSEELERAKYFRSLGNGKIKKRSKKALRDGSSVSDLDESSNTSPVCYKQGSSSLGARIAQSDYADPTTLFTPPAPRPPPTETISREDSIVEHRESETDSFYERSFETIENYVDAEPEETFRDSAIFSDSEDQPAILKPQTKSKVAPPVPAKKKSEFPPNTMTRDLAVKYKPIVPRKPNYLESVTGVSSTIVSTCSTDDLSAGQSQPGWVRKMVGQLQGHIET